MADWPCEVGDLWREVMDEPPHGPARYESVPLSGMGLVFRCCADCAVLFREGGERQVRSWWPGRS